MSNATSSNRNAIDPGIRRQALRAVSSVVLGLLACGPRALVDGDGTGSAGTDDPPRTSAASTGGLPDPTGSSAGGPADGTTDGTSDSSNGSVFLPQPDGGDSFECDVFAQDCPSGEKCMPWANDGGGVWNAARCSPIADDPGAAGDPCTVEGSGVSGIDDCELGAMCWDVDPETNAGTCVRLCGGSEDHPFCDDPSKYCALTAEAVLSLCLPLCNPLTQDCPEGQGCYAVSDAWTCVFDGSGDMGAWGDPCEFINACEPGFLCMDATFTPDCAGSTGCCTDLCALSAPLCLGAAEGQECTPWYDGDALPGYELVGICILPG